MKDKQLAQEIYDMAISCGFDNCGIIPIADMDGYAARLQERLERVPQSAPFYQQIDGMTHIAQRFPWAKSLVICTTWLGKYRYPAPLRGKYGKAFLLSASSDRSCPAYQEKLRFEQWLRDRGIRSEGGDSYGHIKVGSLRYAAMMAGLGIIRKNNFFYSEKGSYVELEGYVIDRECELKQECNLPPCGEHCTLCQDACKTRALSAPYTMNPLACVSFWTTFGQGQVPPMLPEPLLEEWICGCDNCQDACPYNRHDWDQGEDFPGLNELVEQLQPEQLVDASDDFLRDVAAPRSVDHITSEQANTFRVNAERVLRNRAK